MPSEPPWSCAGLPRAERGCLSRAEVASPRALRAVKLPVAAVTLVAVAVPFNLLLPPLEGRAVAVVDTWNNSSDEDSPTKQDTPRVVQTCKRERSNLGTSGLIFSGLVLLALARFFFARSFKASSAWLSKV